MIKDKNVAKHISKLMHNITSQLNDSLFLVQDKCSNDEFNLYKKAIAYIMGEICVGVLNPLYMENPEIKPDNFYLPCATPKKDES